MCRRSTVGRKLMLTRCSLAGRNMSWWLQFKKNSCICKTFLHSRNKIDFCNYYAYSRYLPAQDLLELDGVVQEVVDEVPLEAGFP